jgi:hypothetical protein
VLAARPSIGKTGLALNTAEHVPFHERRPVVVASLEMSAGRPMIGALCEPLATGFLAAGTDETEQRPPHAAG